MNENLLEHNDQNKVQYPAISIISSTIHAVSMGARELTHLVAEVHGTILQLPSPFNRHHQPDRRFAPFPYRIIAHSFGLLARLSQVFLPAKTEFNHPHGRRIHAALNGVCGDKLSQWDNPLAQEMSLRAADGSALDHASWVQTTAKGHVIFIHGLCCSEFDWQSEAHLEFQQDLLERKHQTAWLRYNSGQSIAENGQQLALLLEATFEQSSKKRPLILIGHSMGGLLIRSACYYGEQNNHRWLKRLSHAAYLGSPHMGAPLEKLGNAANNILGFTPYTKPFMRLGNIRSQGIKDLRHGKIHHEEAPPPPLTEHIQHLFVAAALKDERFDNTLGDGLVPVYSALAQDHQGDLLTAPFIERSLIDEIGHLALLTDVRVYQILKDWLAVV